MKYAQLSERLRGDASGFASAWADAFRACPLRMPGQATIDIERWIAPIVEGLADAFAPKPRADGRCGEPVTSLMPGAPELRDIEKSAAFLGARLAVDAATGFDVAAVFVSLRQLLNSHAEPSEQAEVDRFCEWLSVMAMDSMAVARARSQGEKMREELEEGSPVVALAPDLVGVFLVASPTRDAVEHILARALLRIARMGAVAIIIDVSGVASGAAAGVIDAVGVFSSHRKIAGRIPVYLSGGQGALWDNVAALGSRVVAQASFENALRAAYEHSAYRVVRRGGERD